jgi:hypothetical protein
MKNKPFILALVLVIILAGCNLPDASQQPTQAPEAVFTQAAQTVAAELTRIALLASPTPNLPTNTFTPVPSDTPIPTATNTPIPCNLASFVTDVTIPDNTKMATSQTFVKTWRIRNIGTCAWNPSYLLIFDHGDGLGVTAGYTQQLTTTVVNPGQTLDITVNMSAPASAGTYTGYWRMRDPGGVIFGITPTGGTFLVKIIVLNTTSITILPVYGESGTVRADGVFQNLELSVGDSFANLGLETFLSYNITSIPSNASIVTAIFDMRNSTSAGNPFTLGALNVFKQDYGTLDGTDYVAGLPGGNLADWGSPAELLNITENCPNLVAAIQSKLGAARFQVRFQFPTGTNGDAAYDKLMYGPFPLTDPINNPALMITYTTP